jgi:hypothetical protein
MWKNVLEPDKPQMTHGAGALHAEYLTLQTHTQDMNYLWLFHSNN